MATKKDFEACASVISALRASASKAGNEECKDGINYSVGFVAEGMARVFEQDNPRFNRALFLKACGMEASE